MSTPDGHLRNAANNGEVERVREYLAAGADPNRRNRFGQTALSLAAGNVHAPVVQLLLEAGADPHVRDNRGFTPLTEVCERAFCLKRPGCDSILTLLVEHTDYSVEELNEALWWTMQVARAAETETPGAHASCISVLKRAGAVMPCRPTTAES